MLWLEEVIITILFLTQNFHACLAFGHEPTPRALLRLQKIGDSPPSAEQSLPSNVPEVDRYEADVVVVGGGLAGLALFIGLATHLPSCKVVLIEKRSHYERAGATLGFAANGAKALNELVDDDEFVQTKIFSHGRDMMADEDIPVHVLPWWIVRDALLERAKELVTSRRTNSDSKAGSERLQLWNGLELNELVEHEGWVDLGFSNCPIRVGSKLVVAADGVRSKVRSLVGLPAAEDTGVRIWRGNIQVRDLEGKDEAAYRALECLLHQGYAPFMVRDSKDGLSYVVVFNHHESIPGLLLWQMGTPLQDDSAISKFFTGDGQNEILEALLQHTPNILYTKLCTINMDDIVEKTDSDFCQGWGGTKRVTLIGDAAHACRPTDGQGANMAFEDACVLVRMLSEEDGREESFLEDIKDLVLEFENERRPRVKRIHQDQAERAMKQGKDWRRWSPEFMDWVYRGV